MTQMAQIVYHVTRKGKDNRNVRVATFVGFKIGDTAVFGFSKCNKKDKFDPSIGIATAILNATNLYNNTGSFVPLSFSKKFEEEASNFSERCIRYFKDAKEFLFPLS